MERKDQRRTPWKQQRQCCYRSRKHNRRFLVFFNKKPLARRSKTIWQHAIELTSKVRGHWKRVQHPLKHGRDKRQKNRWALQPNSHHDGLGSSKDVANDAAEVEATLARIGRFERAMLGQSFRQIHDLSIGREEIVLQIACNTTWTTRSFEDTQQWFQVANGGPTCATLEIIRARWARRRSR